MAKLVFYDKDHIYELDGEQIPSVSELSRFVSREIYGDVNKYTLDMACDKGSRIHRATEQLDKTGHCEVDEEILPYIEQYIQFRKDYGIKDSDFIAIEKPLASAKMKFAGTLDRVVSIKKELSIVDIKSGAQIKKQLAQIQLPAYQNLWEENYPDSRIIKRYILQLQPNKYKLIEFDFNTALFDACYTLHQALAPKRKRRK